MYLCSPPIWCWPNYIELRWPSIRPYVARYTLKRTEIRSEGHLFSLSNMYELISQLVQIDWKTYHCVARQNQKNCLQLSIESNRPTMLQALQKLVIYLVFRIMALVQTPTYIQSKLEEQSEPHCKFQRKIWFMVNNNYFSSVQSLH